jgi:hypothetical protein
MRDGQADRCRPWISTIHPVDTTTTMIKKPRPEDIDGKEEEAEENVTRRHEVRSRVKVVQGVGAVWEEQDVVVMQKRVVWRDLGSDERGVKENGAQARAEEVARVGDGIGKAEVILGGGAEETEGVGQSENPGEGVEVIDEGMKVDG